MSGDGIYNQSAGMLVWRIEGIEPGNYSTLNARFAYENGDVDFSEPATLYYKSSTGGMMEPVKSNSTQDMILLKTVDAGDGSATLTFFYNNTKSNIVASIGGFELGWLGWYFISSMLASMMLNKIFNVV